MAELRLVEPTGEQCSANAHFDIDEQTRATAAWYPQMGGYVGKCWLITGVDVEADSCVDVYIWHDGQFPFESETGRDPIKIHHCIPEQFRELADVMERANQGSA